MAEPKLSFVQSAFTRKLVFWVSLIVALAADLATKAWAERAVKPAGDDIIPVMPGLAWKWAENEGAAFSMFDGHTWFLLLVASLVLSAVMWYAWRTEPKRWTYLLALGLVASGAIGNLHDRALTGAVRDFIFFNFDLPLWGRGIGIGGWRIEIPRRWPVFNIADIAIFIGVGILLVHSFRKEEKPGDKKPEASKPATDAAKDTPANPPEEAVKPDAETPVGATLGSPAADSAEAR